MQKFHFWGKPGNRPAWSVGGLLERLQQQGENCRLKKAWVTSPDFVEIDADCFSYGLYFLPKLTPAETDEVSRGLGEFFADRGLLPLAVHHCEQDDFTVVELKFPLEYLTELPAAIRSVNHIFSPDAEAIDVQIIRPSPPRTRRQELRHTLTAEVFRSALEAAGLWHNK